MKPRHRSNGRVEGDARTSRFEDGEDRDDEFRRTFEIHAHEHLGTDAERAQAMRELIGAAVEFFVGQCSAREAERRSLRHFSRPSFEPLVQTERLNPRRPRNREQPCPLLLVIIGTALRRADLLFVRLVRIVRRCRSIRTATGGSMDSGPPARRRTISESTKHTSVTG